MESILKSSLDCIVAMDQDGRIVEFNSAAERTFGFARDEVVGRLLVDVIVPPALREPHRRGLARYLATGEGPVLSRRVEINAVRRDDQEFPIELAITPTIVDGRHFFTGYLRDISERRHAEKERTELLGLLDCALAETELLNRIAVAAAGEDDLERVFALALEQVRQVLPLTGGALLMRELEQLVVQAAIGPYADDVRGKRLSRGDTPP